MAKLEIITYGNPILRKVAERVEKIDDEIKKIIKDLKDTLAEENGIGLAAPQVGISKRILIVDLSKSNEDKKVALINPKIIYSSKEVGVYNEGCLSIPDVWGDVIRPIEIRVKAQLENGDSIVINADGLFARVLQHELDHLDGKLFIDYLSEEDLEKNREKLENLLKLNKEKLGNIEK